ncbi:MAG: hypothetical protein ACOZD0_08925 [Pseudomonadota bacterium]
MSNFEAHSNCAGTISSSWCQVTAGVFQRTNKCATGRSCPHKEALFYKCKAYKGILALSRHAPFIGAKIVLGDALWGGKMPAEISLGVTAAMLVGGVLFSLWRTRDGATGPSAPAGAAPLPGPAEHRR